MPRLKPGLEDDEDELPLRRNLLVDDEEEEDLQAPEPLSGPIKPAQPSARLLNPAYTFKGYDPTKFRNIATREVFKHEIAAAEREYERRDALDRFTARQNDLSARRAQRAAATQARQDAARQKREVNSATLADFDARGVKHRIDPVTGLVSPKRDAEGAVQFTKKTFAVTYDKAGRAVRAKRDELGTITTRDADADAPLGTDPDRPHEIYRKNKHQPWDYVGTVEQGLQSDDPRVQEAAAKGQAGLEKDFGEVASKALTMRKGELLLQAGQARRAAAAKEQALPAAQERLNRAKAAAAEVGGVRGFFSSVPGDEKTRRTAELQTAQQEFDEVQAGSVFDQEAWKPQFEAARQDAETWAALVQQEGSIGAAAQRRRELIEEEGGNPAEDPVLTALGNRRKQLGMAEKTEDRSQKTEEEARLREDPKFARSMAARDAIRAEHDQTQEALKAQREALPPDSPERAQLDAQAQAGNAQTNEKLKAVGAEMRAVALPDVSNRVAFLEAQAASEGKPAEKKKIEAELRTLNERFGGDDFEAAKGEARQRMEKTRQALVTLRERPLAVEELHATLKGLPPEQRKEFLLANRKANEEHEELKRSSELSWGQGALNAVRRSIPSAMTRLAGAGKMSENFVPFTSVEQVHQIQGKLGLPTWTDLAEKAKAFEKDSNYAMPISTAAKKKVTEGALLEPRWWLENGLPVITELATDLGISALTGPAAPFTFMALGGAKMAGDAYNDAEDWHKAHGKSDKDARTLATAEGLIVGVIGGLLDRIPAGQFLTRGPGKKILFEGIRNRIVRGGVAGFTVEALPEMGQELTAMVAEAGFREPAEAFADGWNRILTAGVLGGAAGASVNVAIGAAQDRSAGNALDALRQKNGAVHDSQLTREFANLPPEALELGALSPNDAATQLAEISTRIEQASAAKDDAALSEAYTERLKIIEQLDRGRQVAAAAEEIEAISAATHPDLADPAILNQTRVVSRALVKLANGAPLEALTALDRKALDAKTPDGVPRVELVEGKPVITQGAIDRLRAVAPGAASLIGSSEAARRAALLAEPQPEKGAKAPKAAGKPSPPGPAGKGTNQGVSQGKKTEDSGQKTEQSLATFEVTVEGEAAPRVVQAATEAEARALVAGDPATKGFVREVVQTAEAAEQEAAAPAQEAAPENAQRSEEEETVFQAALEDIEREAGKALTEKQAGVLRAKVKQVAPALVRWRKAFDAVGWRIVIRNAQGKRRSTAGAILETSRGGGKGLVLSLGDMIEERVGYERGLGEQAVMEEAVHAVSERLHEEGKIDLDQIWQDAPEALKAHVREVYKQGDDYTHSREFWRLLIQGTINLGPEGWNVDGKVLVTEQVTPSFLQGIRNALAELFKFFTDLRIELRKAGASAEYIALVEEARDLTLERIKEVDGFARRSSEGQTDVTEPAAKSEPGTAPTAERRTGASVAVPPGQPPEVGREDQPLGAGAQAAVAPSETAGGDLGATTGVELEEPPTAEDIAQNEEARIESEAGAMDAAMRAQGYLPIHEAVIAAGGLPSKQHKRRKDYGGELDRVLDAFFALRTRPGAKGFLISKLFSTTAPEPDDLATKLGYDDFPTLLEDLENELVTGDPQWVNPDAFRSSGMASDAEFLEAQAQRNAERGTRNAESRLRELQGLSGKRALSLDEQAEREALEREVGQGFMDFAGEQSPEAVAGAQAAKDKKAQAEEVERRRKARLIGGNVETQQELTGPTTDKAGNLTLFAQAQRQSATLSLTEADQRRYLERYGLKDDTTAQEAIRELATVREEGANRYAQGDLFAAGGEDRDRIRGGREAAALSGETTQARLIAQRRAENAPLVNPGGEAAREALRDRGRLSSLIPELIGPNSQLWDIRGAIIEGPEDAFKLLQAVRSPYVESLKIAVLNSAHQVEHSEIVAIGSLNEAIAHPREILRALSRIAATSKARNLLIAHNHPSGQPEPSEADRRLTQRISEVARQLGFGVVDHVITNGERYFSFRESGLSSIGESASSGKATRPKAEPDALRAIRRGALPGLAPWETVPRSAAIPMSNASDFIDLIAGLRNDAPGAGHLFYLSTKYGIIGMERLTVGASPSDINGRLGAGAMREGAYAVIAHLPGSFGPRQLQSLRDFSQLMQVNLLDVIFDEGNVPGSGRPFSSKEAGILQEEGALFAQAQRQAVDGQPVVQLGNAVLSGAGTMLLAQPQTAYHGTPHKVDRFSTEKIGTGEGAQVFGWGLYFAEEPQVAMQYKERLGDGTLRMDGQPMDPSNPRHLAAQAIHIYQTPTEAFNVLRTQMGQATPSWRRVLQEAINAIRANDIPKVTVGSGNTYTVALDVEPEELLDWDKPLSEQSEKVRAALERVAEKSARVRASVEKEQLSDGDTGSGIYQWLSGLLRDDVNRGSAEASQLLSGLGIPGIRYLDQGSRMSGATKYVVRWDASDTRAEVFDRTSGKSVGVFDTFKAADAWVTKHAGAPTYNFVLFDDSKIRITHENGQPVEPREVLAAQAQRDPNQLGFDFEQPDLSAVDVAASAALTASQEPSDAQKEAGNYKKGHTRISGLDISIENPAGSVRSGVSKDGKRWSATLGTHYGYIRGTEGRDGDQVDAMIKPGTPEDWAGTVFVVNQKKENGHFDEHKAVLGAASEDEARALYLSNYSAGWEAGPIAAMPMTEFKRWLAEGDPKKPAPEARKLPEWTSEGSPADLIRANLPHAEAMATRWFASIPGVGKDDIRQTARIALVKAAHAYGQGAGSTEQGARQPFGPYGATAVKNALRDFYRKQLTNRDLPTLDEPLGEETDETRGSQLADETANVERAVELGETADTLDELIAELAPRAQAIIAGLRQGKTLNEIAADVGLNNRESASNHAQIALKRLRQKLGERGIRGRADMLAAQAQRRDTGTLDLFTKAVRRTLNKQELKAKGWPVSTQYDEAVSRNLEQMNAPLTEWNAVPIKGFTDTVNDKGAPVKMPEFAFPAGYTKAPTIYPPSSDQGACALCGHDIVNHFWIQNDAKKWTMPVGSECITRFSEGAKSGERMAKEVQWEQNRSFLREAQRVRDELRNVFTFRAHQGYGKYGTGWVNADTRKAFDALSKLIGDHRADKKDAWTDADSDGVVSAWANRKGDAVRATLADVDALFKTPYSHQKLVEHYTRQKTDAQKVLEDHKLPDGTPVNDQITKWQESRIKTAETRLAELIQPQPRDIVGPASTDLDKLDRLLAQAQAPESDNPMDEIMRLLNSEALDPLIKEAAAEKPGEFTIGRKELAFGAKAPEIRAMDELMKGALTPQTKAEWRAEAERRLAEDYTGEAEKLITKAFQGGLHDNIEAIMSEMVLAHELSQPESAERSARTRVLTLGHRLAGRAWARAGGARVDPDQPPETRARLFLNEVINGTNPELIAKIEKASAEAQKPGGDQAELQRLLEEARQESERIKGELAKMGIDINELLGGEYRLVLKGAPLVQAIVSSLDEKMQRALKLMQGGTKTFEEVAKELKLTATEAEAAYDAFRAELEKKLLGKIKKKSFNAATDLDNLGAGVLLAQPQQEADEVSDEEAQARLDQIMKMMGFPPKKEMGKFKVVKRKRARSTEQGAGSQTAPAPLTPVDYEARKQNELLGGPERNIDIQPTGALPIGATEGQQSRLKLPFEEWMVRKELGDAVTVVRVARIAQAAGGGFFDQLYEFWINNILSGPQTHIANVAGSALAGGWDLSVQRGFEAMANLVYRNADAAQVGEIGPILRGILPGLAGGWRLAQMAWSAEADFFKSSVLDEQMNLFDDFEKGGGIKPSIPGKKGRIIRMPGRALLFMDSLFKGMIGRLEAGAQAYRIAKKEGLKGDALSTRMRVLINSPGSEAWQRAYAKAIEMTFQEKSAVGDLAGSIKALKDSESIGHQIAGRLFSFIFPFVRTPWNIFKMGLRKTPLGTLNMLTRFGHAGFVRIQNGKPIAQTYLPGSQIKHLAEQVIAWGTMAALWSMVEGDEDDEDKPILMTGSAPASEESAGIRALKQRAYGGPYQIRIGGRDGFTINYGRYEPAATVLGTVADAIRALKSGTPAAEKMDMLFGYFVAQAQAKTFLQSQADMLKAVQDGKGMTEKAKRMFAQAIVPNLVRQPLRNLDEFARESRSAPFAYQALPIGSLAEKKIDQYGKPVEKAGNALSRLLVPTGTKPAEELTAADALLLRWNTRNPTETWAPSPPTRFYKRDNKTHEMTREEYARFSEKVGARVTVKLLNRVPQRAVANPTKADKDKIKNAFESAREEVREQMFPKKPAVKAIAPYVTAR